MRHFVIFPLLFCLSTPVFGVPPLKKFTPINLQPQGNRKLSDNQGSGVDGNELSSLKTGPGVYGKVEFNIGETLIQLGSKILEDFPELVEGIEVGKPAPALHFLHSTCWGPDEEDTLIGEYRVNFEDRSAIIIPILYGVDVVDWFFDDPKDVPSVGVVAWEGTNKRSLEVGKGIRLFRTSWENPWPNKKVTSIDYYSNKEGTRAAPFCIAITVEETVPQK